MLSLLIPIGLQILLPIAMLVWQWRLRSSSWLVWWLKTIFIGSYLLGITLVALWLLVPWYLGYVYLGLFGWATVRSFYRHRKILKHPPDRDWNDWWRVTIYALAIAFCTHILLNTASAYRLPANPPISLSFPLKNGTYYVANGGSSTLLNAHLEFLNNRKYRGNSYAVDILKLNKFGLRSSKLLPDRLEDYAIFGEPLYAPCTGIVSSTENSLPDQTPPQSDLDRKMGNHILLECKDATILLAHLQQGSVKVKSGDRITENQLLAKIGNTGKTDEPHLHIHAQRPGSRVNLFETEPLPMLFDRRFLVRNQQVRC